MCASRKSNYLDKFTSTSDLRIKGMDKCTEVPVFSRSDNTIPSDALPTDMEKICPICSTVFRKDISFIDFQEHVESHFTHDIDSFEIF